MKHKQGEKSALTYNCDYSGCGYLRTFLPIEYLNSIYGNKKQFKGMVLSKFTGDVNFLSSYNTIRFQRQTTTHHLDYIRKVRQLQKAGKFGYFIMYDIDDSIIDIPDYNYCKKSYEEEQCKSALKEIFANVDLFTVSTNYLKYAMQRLKGNSLSGCKFMTIPNLIPRYLYDRPRNLKVNSKPKVVYAGSQTHYSDALNDMGDIGLLYDLVLNTKDEFDWVFLGGCPQAIKKLGVEYINWATFYSYPNILREINADFGFAPLLDNEFNRCKSNIKLLEYWSSFIIPICSNIEPYKKEASLFLSPTWQENRDMIKDIFNDKPRMEELINQGRNKMKNYWLEDNIFHYERLFDIK